jgi:hypothetical protein
MEYGSANVNARKAALLGKLDRPVKRACAAA